MKKVLLYIDDDIINDIWKTNPEDLLNSTSSADITMYHFLNRIDEFKLSDEIKVIYAHCRFPRTERDIIGTDGESLPVVDKRFRTIINNTGTINSIEQITKKVNEILNKDSEYEKLEVVTDMCLDGGYMQRTGVQLIKYMLTHLDNPDYFYKEQKLLITMISKYIAFDMDVFDKLISEQELKRLEMCFNPAKRDSDGNFTMDEEFEAFPQFYFDYHLPDDNPKYAKINEYLLKGTFYGNMIGLILARLYKSDAEENENGN